MAKRLYITLCAAALALSVYAADDAQKEMQKNREAVVAAYASAPTADSTIQSMDNFIARYKDSNKYEASGVQYMKAMAYYNSKDFGKAYDAFDRLVNDFSSMPYADSAMYRMGECRYNTGRFADAIDIWNKFRFKYSDSLFNMEAAYGIALCHLSLEEYLKADRALNDFLSRYDHYRTDENIMLIGGVIDYYLGNFKESVDKLKKLRNGTAYYYRGHSLLKLNQFLEAASSFKKIGEEYKKSSYAESALYNKAEAFYRGENFAVSASDYKDFMALYPNSNLEPYAAFKRGSALFMEKKFEPAVLSYKSVIAGGGDKRVRAYAQYLVGEIYREQKQYQSALSAYSKVLDNFPDIYDVYGAAQLKASWCHVLMKNYAKAEEELNLFTQKFYTSESLPLAYYLLGNAYFMQGKYPMAVQSYKYLLDKFKYSDLTEAALLMTEIAYYKQDQHSLLASEASHMLNILADQFQSPKSKIRSRSYYYLGMAYFKMGMFGPASKAFKEIVDRFYDSDIATEARANLAWCFYELENYKGARTMARDVINSNYGNRAVKKACEILIAHSLFSEKEYEKAAAKYGEFAYTYKADKDFEPVAEALFQQGKVLELQEFYMDAIKSWDILASNYPKSKRAPEATYKKSDIYFKAQQYDKAIAGFQEVIRRWPDSEVAEDSMLSIAEVYYNSEQNAKAVEAYNAFLKKYPDSSKIKSVEEGMQRADYKKAEKKADPDLLLAFVEKYPDSNLAVDALYKAAELLYQGNKLQRAVDIFSKVIEDFPNDTLSLNAHYYIGACYEGLSKFEEAVSAYKTFLKNYPKHELASDVMFRLATAAYTSKNFGDAAFYYERIVEKYPGTEFEQNAMYNAGLTYMELNKMDDAIRMFRAYMKAFPKDEKTKDIPAQIAGIYLEQKRYNDAIKAYMDIYEAPSSTDDQKNEALYRIGDIYTGMEEQESAIRTLSGLMSAKPKDSIYRLTGLINLATLYEEKQQWVNAVEAYGQIASSGGKKEYVDGAAARAKEIKAVYPDLFKAAGGDADKKAPSGKAK